MAQPVNPSESKKKKNYDNKFWSVSAKVPITRQKSRRDMVKASSPAQCGHAVRANISFAKEIEEK